MPDVFSDSRISVCNNSKNFRRTAGRQDTHHNPRPSRVRSWRAQGESPAAMLSGWQRRSGERPILRSTGSECGNNLGTITPKHRGEREGRADQRARRVNKLATSAQSAKPPSPVQSGRRLQTYLAIRDLLLSAAAESDPDCPFFVCPSKALELSCGSSQVAIRNDVVAVEHGAGLMPCELHRDALGYAAANHVPDRRSSEVVRNAPSATGGRTIASLGDDPDEHPGHQ